MLLKTQVVMRQGGVKSETTPHITKFIFKKNNRSSRYHGIKCGHTNKDGTTAKVVP